MQENSVQIPLILQFQSRYPPQSTGQINGLRIVHGRRIEIYEFPAVGRVVYISALVGLIEGQFGSPDEFPDWLKVTQSELADWLRGAPRRKSKYFLDMANLESYELVPDARDDPRGQFKAQ
ncbi:hypothetical protein [Mesorhizobium sp. ISC11]|uniref:hypothetical protein n=1 Tax=Mesorhizobium sp. ISC11 TaxID=3076428 RepID=UPI00301D8D67